MTLVAEKSLNKGEKGFTLKELLIVLAILAVLAAVVIPNVTGIFGRATPEVSSLIIMPEEVEPGALVTVQAKIVNDATVERTITLGLLIDDTLADIKEFTVPGSSTGTVAFTYSTGVVGIHEVRLQDLVGKLVVRRYPVLPTPTPQPPIVATYPEDKAEVDWHIKVQGVSQEAVLSSGLNLYLLVYPVEFGGPWQVQPLVTLHPSGYWEANAYFGRDPSKYPSEKGHRFYSVVIATKLRLEPGQQWYSIPDYVYVSRAIEVTRK